MAEQHFAQSKSYEWYTPPKYLEPVRELMGGIDVDPASCAAANQNVMARTFFTIEDDGFNREWAGRVFLNPPYGNVGGFAKDGSWNPKKGDDNQKRWSYRLIAQYKAGITKEAVLLVTAATGDLWFAPLYEFPMCFPRRIKFIAGAGQDESSNTKGPVFVYLGPQLNRFYDLFSSIGAVMVRYCPHSPPQRLCAACGGPVPMLASGRVPQYCKDACKQRAYRERNGA
jgi:hypothetical protein